MSKISFNAELKDNRGGKFLVKLELFRFKEDDMYIRYCPALDLSAYGRTDEEAMTEFEEVFRLYLTYCINKGTLRKDLESHGWIAKGKKNKNMQAPNMANMFEHNETLRDIIFNKEFEKISQQVEMPEAV